MEKTLSGLSLSLVSALINDEVIDLNNMSSVYLFISYLTSAKCITEHFLNVLALNTFTEAILSNFED